MATATAMESSPLPAVPPPTFGPSRGQVAWNILKPIGRRARSYLVVFIVAVTINFFLPRVMPGDPVQKIVDQLKAASGAPPSNAQVDAIRKLLGGNGNLFRQYLEYWKSLVTGDFGISISHYPQKVAPLIFHALPWTAGLVFVSIIIAWLVGVLLGAISGWNRGRPVDTVFTLGFAALVALPSFWAALVLQNLIAYKWGWLPAGGGYDPSIVPDWSLGYLFSVVKYAILPGLTVVAISFPGFGLGMRNMMAMTASDDYVLLAKAKGLPTRDIVGRYAARNAILPSVAGLASAIGGAIGGMLIIEVVFTYPGLGTLLVQGIGSNDYPLIQAIFLIVTVSVLVMNFIADSLYTIIDPRTREAAK
jgi:peptide/nickel transport system permease protein